MRLSQPVRYWLENLAIMAAICLAGATLGFLLGSCNG